MIRAFIGLPLSDAQAQTIAGLTQRLRPFLHDAAFVRPAQCELTVAFLGAVSAAAVSALDRDLAQAAWPPAFTLELAGLCYFPPHTKRTLAFVGPVIPPLVSLVRIIQERAHQTVGFQPPRRAFVPHVTVARLKRETVSAKSLPSLSLQTRVNRVTIYRSVLSPAGASHSILTTYHLTNP